MNDKSEIAGRSVAAEMAVYIGVTSLSAPTGTPILGEGDVILLLSTDGFTASEINEHLERAMLMALPGRNLAPPAPSPR